jgi:Flp pilus assembly protein protease CpaA
MSFILPSLILAAGAANDLYNQKVHNWLFLICLGCGLLYSIAFGGFSGLLDGLGGLLAALVTTLPLVLIRVLGAGDLKIFMAFGLTLSWQVVVSVAVYALFAAAAIGFLQVTFSGQLISTIKNMYCFLHPAYKVENQKLHRIPYTVALLLGWAMYLIQTHYGEAIL